MFYNDLDEISTLLPPEMYAPLKDIFEEANGSVLYTSQQKRLHQKLSALLETLKNRSLLFFSSSPSGENHVFSYRNIYALVNIYGIKVLYQSWLIDEGELGTYNIRWMEKDHLLVVDFYFIVHEEITTCVCHYTNDNDGFIYFTPIISMETYIPIRSESAQKEITSPNNDNTDWF